MDHLFNWFFWLDSSQCYFPIGTKHFLSLFGRNTGFCNFQFQESQGMLICKCGKVSDWFSIAPLCSLWFRTSVGNVTVKGEDLCTDTLCKMLNFSNCNQDLNLCSGQVNMQLCGFHCIPGYSISVFYSNFIHFTCLRVVYREFLRLGFTTCDSFQLN